jgi:pyruvate dehydrogenase E2 component (dihydrolipoamide acetyltransferase)
VIYRDYINIGVAMDTPRGLVVPCLRAVADKTAIDIGRELKVISDKAVAAKLTAQDFQGGGFTISNLGGLGVSGLLPIVNWPEVAILGVASSREHCVLDNGIPRNRLLMPLTLGFDHRVINGADAARFLGFLKTCIEQPGMLLISL